MESPHHHSVNNQILREMGLKAGQEREGWVLGCNQGIFGGEARSWLMECNLKL